ncbi:MAG: flavoprotein, partial [Actinomycetes bacterium]
MTSPRQPWIVGISGASGTAYAAAVINGLLDAGESVDLVVSKSARLTIVDEIGLAWRDAHWREDLSVLLDRDTTDIDVVLWASTDFAA